MVFEKAARKREEAAAVAAIQATKPVFTKIGNGLEYLHNTFKSQQEKNEMWMDTVDERQYVTEDYINLIHSQIKSNAQSSARMQQAQEAAAQKIEEHITDIGYRMLVRCQCGATLSPVQIVCHRCGSISAEFPYDLAQLEKVFDIQANCAEELTSLSTAIKTANDMPADCLYPELKDKILNIEHIAAVARTHMDLHKDDGEYSIHQRVYRRAKKFLGDARKKSIEIAVVGNVKAGKSSLINAFLGNNMASVGATPETSVLVKYRTSPNKNYIRVSFYTEKQWNALWATTQNASVFRAEYKKYNAEAIRHNFLGRTPYYTECTSEELPKLIMQWTSSDNAEHFFVKELEVGYCDDTFPHDVTLVDTPGLRDPVKFRSDITRRYIKNSDWVLACISTETLSSQDEFDFLSRIVANNGQRTERILVVSTKVDMLPISDCRLKQDEFIQRMAKLYGSPGSATEHFVPVSAETHTLLDAYLSGQQQSKEEENKLRRALINIDIYTLADIANRKDDIYKYAGINRLFEQIDKLILQHRREDIICEIEADYKQTLDTIYNQVSDALSSEGVKLYQLITHSLDYKQQMDNLRAELQEVSELKDSLTEVMRKISLSRVKILPDGGEF